MDLATFAGGCFWCTEQAFDALEGIISVTSGYTGGKKVDPTYEEVCTGTTGHVEAVQIVFDPKKVSYAQLLDTYWHAIDPMTNEGQFCDIGTQYKPIIFYHTEIQKQLAESSKQRLMKKMGPILVEILPAQDFYPAEEYHQKFYQKSPEHYASYQRGSRRKEKLNEIWKGK